jgi:hypothetical protein
MLLLVKDKALSLSRTVRAADGSVLSDWEISHRSTSIVLPAFNLSDLNMSFLSFPLVSPAASFNLLQ